MPCCPYPEPVRRIPGDDGVGWGLFLRDPFSGQRADRPPRPPRPHPKRKDCFRAIGEVA